MTPAITSSTHSGNQASSEESSDNVNMSVIGRSISSHQLGLSISNSVPNISQVNQVNDLVERIERIARPFGSNSASVVLRSTNVAACLGSSTAIVIQSGGISTVTGAIITTSIVSCTVLLSPRPGTGFSGRLEAILNLARGNVGQAADVVDSGGASFSIGTPENNTTENRAVASAMNYSTDICEFLRQNSSIITASASSIIGVILSSLLISNAVTLFDGHSISSNHNLHQIGLNNRHSNHYSLNSTIISSTPSSGNINRTVSPATNTQVANDLLSSIFGSFSPPLILLSTHLFSLLYFFRRFAARRRLAFIQQQERNRATNIQASQNPPPTLINVVVSSESVFNSTTTSSTNVPNQHEIDIEDIFYDASE